LAITAFARISGTEDLRLKEKKKTNLFVLRQIKNKQILLTENTLKILNINPSHSLNYLELQMDSENAREKTHDKKPKPRARGRARQMCQKRYIKLAQETRLTNIRGGISRT
jgi:hypothetical protein